MVPGELITVNVSRQSITSTTLDPDSRSNIFGSHDDRPSGEISTDSTPRREKDEVENNENAPNDVVSVDPDSANDLEAQFSGQKTEIPKNRTMHWTSRLWKKVRDWRAGHRRQDQVYGSKMRPTSRLILLVVIMSFIMALTVAGTAVGLQWASLTDSRKEALRSQLGLAANAVGSFVSIQRVLNSQQTTATIVTNVIKEIGYNANLQTMIQTQQKAANVAGMLIENLYSRVSADKTMFASQLIQTRR